MCQALCNEHDKVPTLMKFIFYWGRKKEINKMVNNTVSGSVICAVGLASDSA